MQASLNKNLVDQSYLLLQINKIRQLNLRYPITD